MKNRIQQFLTYKQITHSEFANSIKVQRSNITHILQGRNQPGFQFITKMLSVYPEINAKWLIMGIGEMLEKDVKAREPELFFRASDLDISDEAKSKLQISNSETDKFEKKHEEKTQNSIISEDYNNVSIPTSSDEFFEKEIQSIVIFYTDRSFINYRPSK